MQNEISYECSRELMRWGARRFILTYAGPGLVAFAIAAALAVVGLNAGKEPAFCGVVIVIWALHGLLWLKYYHESVKRGEELPDRNVVLRIEPECVTFQTSMRTSSLKWAGIQKLWVYPEVILLFYSKTAYSMLPAASLSEDTRGFIEHKVREHGGKVVAPRGIWDAKAQT